MKKLVIIGAGIAGNLTAMYFRKLLPEIDITLVGRLDRKRPIVGESTVELTTHFLEALGLGTLLEESHYHKYGLTYYFKLQPDPSCRRYVIHEAPGVLRMPAYNIYRNRFDRDIAGINQQLGIRILLADIAEVALAEKRPDRHVLTVRHSEGEQSTLEADWIVDASGRNRFLARKLQLNKPVPYQRSSFWFRLTKFDRTRLREIDDTRTEHRCYDPYYVTHHFYGKGYWIWLIPMRSENGDDLISIGVTYRAELMDGEVTSMEQFIALMQRDHPVIAGLIHTGVIVDTNLYKNYMYESSQYYSENGWFLVGDSGFTFDPANSAGLAYLAHQIPQVAAMIKKDMAGTLTPAYVASLEQHLVAQLALQDAWSKWYEIMHEPLKMAWTLLVANLGYFHISLPNYVNGGFLDGHQARHFADLVPRYMPDKQPAAYPFPCLIDAVLASDGNKLADCIPNLYPKTVNWDLYRPDEAARPRYAARYFRMLVRMRLKLMGMVKWQFKFSHFMLLQKQLRGLIADAGQSVALTLFPSLFYKYGTPPESLASPFEPHAAFLSLAPHDAAACAPLLQKNGRQLSAIAAGSMPASSAEMHV